MSMKKSPLIVPIGGIVLSLAFGIVSGFAPGGWAVLTALTSFILGVITVIALYTYVDIHEVSEHAAIKFVGPLFVGSFITAAIACGVGFTGLAITFSCYTVIFGFVTVVTGTLAYKEWVKRAKYGD